MMRRALQITAVMAGPILCSGAAWADDAPCVSVSAGNVVVPSFDCLNAKLRAMTAAEQLRQGQSLPRDADANAPPDRLGQTTHAGAALRFGPNFGISSKPYRPTNDAFYGNPNGLAGLLGGH